MTTRTRTVTTQEVKRLCERLGDTLRNRQVQTGHEFIKVFPLSSGGLEAARALKDAFYFVEIVNRLPEADLFIADVLYNGEDIKLVGDTSMSLRQPLIALVDNRSKVSPFSNDKVVFPWTYHGPAENRDMEEVFKRFLSLVGEDTNRGGLLETPKRVAKAWNEWTSGYKQDPAEILKTFDDGAATSSELVIVKDIPFYSHCEHHLAPFFGTVTIGYIPNGRIVGLSKLSRLTDVFAKRLQVQERLTSLIADAIEEHLTPLGVGVIVKARHLCMESRGISRQGCTTETIQTRGAIKASPSEKAEFRAAARS